MEYRRIIKPIRRQNLFTEFFSNKDDINLHQIEPKYFNVYDDGDTTELLEKRKTNNEDFRCLEDRMKKLIISNSE
jgi:hypothetical protein